MELPSNLQHTLESLSDGDTIHECAIKLGVSERTIKRWRSQLYDEMGADNGLQAVAMGKDRGYLPVAQKYLDSQTDRNI